MYVKAEGWRQRQRRAAQWPTPRRAVEEIETRPPYFALGNSLVCTRPL